MATLVAEAQSPATAAARLEPVIRDYADQSERDHRLALPIVEAMRAEGLFRLLTPRTLGGGEADPQTLLETIEGLARVDGSTGWCLFIATGGSLFGGFLPDATAEEVFGNPDTIVGGSVFPPGRAVATDGGYEFSGQWAFASGCQHTTWLGAFAATFDGDEPRRNPMGAPELRVGVLPSRDARIVETWDVSGLVGTGSHDFTLDRYFIPVERTFAVAPVPRGRHYQGPTYRMPFLSMFGWPIAAVALGIAQASIDACRDLAINKVPRGSETTLAKRPLFQYQLADAVMMASSGRAWLHKEMKAMWETVNRGEAVSIEQRAVGWLSASHAVRASAAAVELMYTAGGGTSNYRKSPLQKHLRDIHAVTQHTVTSPQTIEHGGRILAGEGPTNPLIYL